MGTEQPDEDRAPAKAAAERERLADERERLADERERVADERELLADEREVRLAGWEARLDQQARSAGRSVVSHQLRSYEAIDRARELLKASQDRLDRSEASLHRADRRDAREQRIIESETADSQARQASTGDEPQEALEARVRRLRQRSTTLASALAATHVELADAYERLAVEQPQRASAHRRRAERSRQAAADLRTAEPDGKEDSD